VVQEGYRCERSDVMHTVATEYYPVSTCGGSAHSIAPRRTGESVVAGEMGGDVSRMEGSTSDE